MNPENLLPPFNIGKSYSYLAIKTTGSKKGWIQNVRTVCCSDNDDTLLSIKSVHLNKKRIQSLLPFIMTTSHAMSTVTPNSVNFVYKNKTRRIFLPLLKHIADPTSSNPYEHLHEVRTTNREKRDVRLARNSARQKSFTSPWRPYHENSLRNCSTKSLELSGVAKKIDNLKKFLFCLLNSSNVLESHLMLVHC